MHPADAKPSVCGQIIPAAVSLARADPWGRPEPERVHAPFAAFDSDLRPSTGAAADLVRKRL